MCIENRFKYAYTGENHYTSIPSYSMLSGVYIALSVNSNGAASTIIGGGTYYPV